ncbi:tetratricopeptide repeat protein, partial [Bacteroidales bacterium OttesenSCG-928-J16]|nr:tetratricopeptide repeat protein [Bacteroidales bacterium OttesenSCG-928-J16]
EVLGRYFYRKAWLYNTHQNLDSLDIIRKYLLESLAHFEKAEKFYRHNQTYMKLGMTLYHSNMIDSALYFLYKSLDERYMKESSASHYGIYRNIYFFIGNIYYLKTEIDSALKYSQLLVNLAEENNDPWPAAEHTMFMGDYYKDIGEHNRSLDYYMDAGNRFLQIEDYLYAAHCRKLAAEQLSVSFGRQNEAIILYEEAIELAQKGENKSFEADCLFLMGNSYERDGKFDHAIDFYRQSALISR